MGLSEYGDFAEAYDQLGRFLDNMHNRKRIRSSLGYLTPAEFEQQWFRGLRGMARQ
jgi:transposase InsO family protein